ncbi:MAG TPA: hypothetical protein VJ397_07730 [Thermoplasmata archaeon]|nr:hypothetical protein [Thermoplasmata archaeon]
MSVWIILSAISALAAGVPALNFALRLRRSNRAAAGLASLLAASLLIHGVYHMLEALSFVKEGILGIEAASAVLVLVFALAYWPLRGRR